MNIEFNNDSNEIRLFLCKPDRTTIAELKHIRQRKLTENYGGINQLSFNVPYMIPSDGGKQVENPTYSRVRGDYLVRLERGVFKDYYIVGNLEEDSNGGESKTVTCHQLHYEWKDKLVRNLKGTMLLYDPSGNNGLLNKTLLTKTDWTIDYVDSSLYNKYRTFDESERNLLEFILDSIDRYGSYIPIIDTVNKRLSIYLDENVGKFKGLEITYGKYLKSLNESESFEDICTRLYIYGKDISINSLNPSGTDYLESLDFYIYGYQEDGNGNVISHSLYMSDGLCKAIRNYNALLTSKAGVFQGYLTQKQGYQTTLTTKQNELRTLQDELKVINDAIDIAIANNQDLTSLNTQKANKQTQINNKQGEVNTVNANISSVNTQISSLQSQIAIENNFTPAQIKERNRFIKEKTWNDSNYTKVEDLYNEGKERLLRLSQPQVVYKTDVIDIIQNLNVPYDRDKVKLGTHVKITYPNLSIDITAKIIVIDHDIDGNNLQLTIANTKDIKSGFMKIKDLLNRSANTSTQVDMSRFKWDLSESNNTEIDRIINNKWDAAKQAVVAGKDENVVVSDRGITLTNITNPQKILRMLSSTIAMSSDGGNTYKLAIDASGVVAESLYGKIIAGNNLTIQNSSGSVVVNSQGMTVTDMIMNIVTSNGKNKISISGADGLKIEKNTGTINSPVWSNQISLDSNGDASFSGKVAIGSGNSIFKADLNGISLGSADFNSAPFRVTPSGQFWATQANVTGSINCTELKVNGLDVLTIDKKIKANALEPLVVGNNVIMGSNVSISWNNVDNKPFIPTNATQIGAIPSTYIDANGIWTGKLNANSIVAGIIDAKYISSEISRVSKTLYLGDTSSNVESGIIFSGSASISKPLGSNGLDISTAGTVNFIYPSVTIQSAQIATQDWVRQNLVAKFG